MRAELAPSQAVYHQAGLQPSEPARADGSVRLGYGGDWPMHGNALPRHQGDTLCYSFLWRRIMPFHTAPAMKPALNATNATNAMITVEIMVIPRSVQHVQLSPHGWRHLAGCVGSSVHPVLLATALLGPGMAPGG